MPDQATFTAQLADGGVKHTFIGSRANRLKLLTAGRRYLHILAFVGQEEGGL